MPPPIAPAARLRADLDALADAVGAARFGLASEEQAERHRTRDEVVTVLHSYLIPRLGDPAAPLLVVVAGPTGSGKSTVVNSLAGREVSRPGALRPTTREPVVWCHVTHAERYARIGEVECRVVPDDHPLLTDITLVDTPDLDSYVVDHRRVTGEVLQHADVVVFLTSAQRYADAVPWSVLNEVDRRGSLILYVLNRLSRRSAGAVSDYTALLRRHGLEPGSVLTIQEQRVRGDAGVLPAKSVRRLADEIDNVARDRVEVLDRVTAGATAYAVEAARTTVTALQRQEQERDGLEAIVERAYADGLAELTRELDRGTLIRAEVVDRWAERVGTGDVARWMRGTASWVRGTLDRISGQPRAVVTQLESEARHELAAAVGSRLDRAARAVATGWEVDPAGRDLLTADLGRAGEDSVPETEAMIDAWLASLTAMVETEAPGRFRAARVTSTGVNAAAIGTILALLASTGGLTGAEVGVAGAAAAAQQGILEHILGKAAAASLAGAAGEGLVASIESVFEAEAGRYRRVLDAAVDPPETAQRILEAVAVVEAESERFHAR